MRLRASKTNFPKKQHHTGQHNGREKQLSQGKVSHLGQENFNVLMLEKSLAMFQMVPPNP